MTAPAAAPAANSLALWIAALCPPCSKKLHDSNFARISAADRAAPGRSRNTAANAWRRAFSDL